ncbi:MAG: 2-oxoacid:acceptor oxidoreductase family protein [Acetobacteraceae bacterium]|nr:2-oxoacid:acceptor oxidoreductase family protein [Acetobacteraceae bacterium]
MTREFLLAGFGGQGVMSLGMVLTYAGMLEGRQVSWMPSYGPEQRGGTANCSVIISTEPIGCPVVTEPDVLVAMNPPSWERFCGAVRPGGLAVVNSSMVKVSRAREDIRLTQIPATSLAEGLGNLRMANMVVLGALVGLTGVVGMDSVKKALDKVFPGREHLVAANRAALDKGLAWVTGGAAAGAAG